MWLLETARDVQVSTRPFGLNSSAVMIEGEGEDPSAVLNRDRQLAYLPATSSSHSFWYKRHWIQVSRISKEGFYGRREDVLEIWYVSPSLVERLNLMQYPVSCPSIIAF